MRAGEYVPRADLIEMFWPHSEEVKGRHSLRQMLYRLKELGFTLDEDGELLSLHAHRVRCDLGEALRADWITEADEDSIAAACDALPGMTRRFSERYGEWIDEIRARLESQFRRAALRVLADAKTEGRWYDVEHWALMLLRTDPLNETAVLARAEGTAMLGSKAEAIEQLDRYLDELGPRAERIGLPAKVLRRRIKEQGERKAGQHALPLVGREEEMRVLTEGFYSEVTNTQCGFYLYGPAGIGKTRVLSECESIARLSGMETVCLHLTAGESETPSKTLVTLSQRLIAISGSLGSEPGALAILRRLSSPSTEASDVTLPGTAVLSSQDIEWSLRSVLSTILEEHRLLLIIDNITGVLSGDLALVSGVLSDQDPNRLTFYFAGREIPQNLFSQRPTAQSIFIPLRMGPLSDTDSATLVQTALENDSLVPSTDLIARTVSMASGNPLFLIELSRSAPGNSPSTPIPRTLHKTISIRLASLSPEQRELCQLISVLKSHATVAALSALSSLSRETLSAGLYELESDGIIRAGSTGTLEIHDCWLNVVQEEISPLTRRILASSAAEYLSRQTPAPNQPDTLFAIASLYEEAKDTDHAFQYYFKAGRQAYEEGFCTQALLFVQRASALPTAAINTLALTTLRVCTQHALGLFADAIDSAHIGLGLPSPNTADSAGFQITMTALLADSCWKAGRDCSDALQRLALLVTFSGIDPFAREYSCFMGIRLAYNIRSSETARHFHMWAGSAGETIGLTPFGALTNLVHHAESGTTEDVLSACRTLQQHDLFALPLHHSALCQRYITQALRWTGDYAAAQDIGALAFEESLRHGLFEEVSLISLVLTFAALDHAQLERAALWLERSAMYSREPRSHERRLSLQHAHARLLLQRSEWKAAYELLYPELDHIAGDSTTRRSIAHAGCLAWAASNCSDTVTVRRMFTLAEPFLSSDAPCLQNDFPVTAFYRALQNIAEESTAAALLHGYCLRRHELHKRPVAPLFSEISNYYGQLSSDVR